MVRRVNFEVLNDEVVEELAYAAIDRSSKIIESDDPETEALAMELRIIGRRLLESTRN